MMIYHYTVGLKIPSIVRDGVLIPSTAFLFENEKPVVWFSSHNFFEPTARKLYVRKGEFRVMTVDEMYRLCGGCFRYGLDSSKGRVMTELGIVDWIRLKDEANMDSAQRAQLAHAARSQSASPKQWYGTITPVPIDRLVCERLQKTIDNRLKWEPL